MPSTCFVIASNTAPRFELPGIAFTGMAAPSRGSREVCTWMITVAPGLVSPEAHSLDRDEVFTVLAGTLRLHPDAEPLLPGDAAVVPAGVPIQLSNPGTEAARAFVVVPGGFSASAAAGTPIATPPWAL